MSHLRHLRSLFLCLEAVLGLKSNLSKLGLVLIGVVDDVGVLTCILGYRGVFFAYEVFESSFGVLYKAKSIWDGIVQKIEGRLASWKMLYLSKGGGSTLIESTLSNSLNYYLFPFAIPNVP